MIKRHHTIPKLLILVMMKRNHTYISIVKMTIKINQQIFNKLLQVNIYLTQISKNVYYAKGGIISK